LLSYGAVLAQIKTSFNSMQLMRIQERKDISDCSAYIKRIRRESNEYSPVIFMLIFFLRRNFINSAPKYLNSKRDASLFPMNCILVNLVTGRGEFTVMILVCIKHFLLNHPN
jgi:hypothetical protein